MFNPTRPTIDRDITNTLHHPELAGVTWDASVTPANRAQTGRNISSKLARHITQSKGVRAAAVVDRDVINVGRVGAPVFSVRPIAGASTTPITYTLISGRAPRGLDERPLARPPLRTSTLVSAVPSLWVHRTPA